MTLKDSILARITSQGPLSVAEYMAECLLHPTLGYYTTHIPFGTKGDFITAPEISQMFGELIGLSLAQTWIDQGAPSNFSLVELGPGRGTLMADILRTTRSVQGFTQAADVFLIEASPRLRDVQRDTVSGTEVTFLTNVSDLPDAPLFCVANEFFDALPIRQFVRAPKHWRERQIGIKEGDLAFGLASEIPQPSLSERSSDTRPNDIVEYAPSLAPIIDAIGTRINSHGGAALIIDYGDWRSLGDTLQAVQQHAPVDPLAGPGTADLTAHVDFEALAQAAPCAYSRVTPQGVFLERLGITQRAKALATQLQDQALESHIAAHRRLTHPQEMGNLFKVMGLFPHGAVPPPGLEA